MFPSRAIAELLGVVATLTRAARRWPLGESRRLGGGDLAKLRGSGLRIVWPGYWDKSQAARAMRPVKEPFLCCRGIFGERLAANPESPASALASAGGAKRPPGYGPRAKAILGGWLEKFCSGLAIQPCLMPALSRPKGPNALLLNPRTCAELIRNIEN